MDRILLFRLRWGIFSKLLWWSIFPIFSEMLLTSDSIAGVISNGGAYLFIMYSSYLAYYLAYFLTYYILCILAIQYDINRGIKHTARYPNVVLL